jgi:CRP-like cAMP-binding protein
MHRCAIISSLREAPIFRAIQEDAVTEILHTAQTRRFERGAKLAKQDARADAVYLISEGAFKLAAISSNGLSLVLALAVRGDVIGDASVLTQMPYFVTATASVESESLFWPAKTFERLARKFPQITVNCMGAAARRESRMIRRISSARNASSEMRIAGALTELAAPPTDTIRVGGRDIAELSDTTVYTVSRVLSRLKRQAIVTGGREHITVLDLQRLRALAEDPPSDT